MFGSEMTNQKSPGPASFASIYVVDRPCPEKRAQKCAGEISVLYIAFSLHFLGTMLYIYHNKYM